MAGISGQAHSCGVTLALDKPSPEPASTWGLSLESKDTTNDRILGLPNDDMLLELNLVDIRVSGNGSGKDRYHC
jgi:hypothetical protein